MTHAPAPIRLRLSRALGFNLQAHSLAANGLPAVNCARPGPYGNPFVIGKHGTRKDCVGYFLILCDGCIPISRGDHDEIDAWRALAAAIPTLAAGLRGKNLACWCPLPKPGEPDICHCQVWLALANDDKPSERLTPICEALGLTKIVGFDNGRRA